MVFEVGDIVECIESTNPYSITVGKMYTVINHKNGNERDYIAVLNNSGLDWYVYPHNFVLVSDREIEPNKIYNMEITIGEFVRAIKDGAKHRYKRGEIFQIIKSEKKNQPQIVLSSGSKFFPNWYNFEHYEPPISIEEVQAKGSNTIIGKMQLTIVHPEYISKAQLAQLKDMLYVHRKYNKYKHTDVNMMNNIASEIKKIKSFKKGYRIACTGRPVSIMLIGSYKLIAMIV